MFILIETSLINEEKFLKLKSSVCGFLVTMTGKKRDSRLNFFMEINRVEVALIGISSGSLLTVSHTCFLKSSL